jgi:thiamine-phosphate pyrophosphorylase
MSLPNNLRRPILCFVTDRRALAKASQEGASHALLQVIVAAAEAGVDWIQIREKDLSTKEYSWLVKEALEHTVRPVGSGDRRAATIIVNGHLSVALARGAGGVHLGVDHLPVAETLSAVTSHYSAHPRKPSFVVGSSCHSLQAAISASDEGADYISFGPVFATPSKAVYGPPQGLAKLEDVCRAVTIPVLAIGGVTLENAASCLEVGASGVAAIRLFQDAPDIRSVVEKLHGLTP